MAQKETKKICTETETETKKQKTSEETKKQRPNKIKATKNMMRCSVQRSPFESFEPSGNESLETDEYIDTE